MDDLKNAFRGNMERKNVRWDGKRDDLMREKLMVKVSEGKMCNGLFQGIEMGFLTIRENEVVPNCFLPVEEKHVPCDTKRFAKNSEYISPVFPYCSYCGRELDLHLKTTLEKKEEHGYRRKMIGRKERKKHDEDYLYCCEKIKKLVKMGFLTPFPTPYGTKEIIINNGIVPKGAFNVITGEELDCDSYLHAIPLINCPYCHQSLI